MHLKLLNSQQHKWHLFLVVILLILLQEVVAQGTYITNGSAFSNGNNCFTLTKDLPSQNGSVWYQNLLSLTTDFDFTFSINLGSKADGADGIAFVIQPVSTGVGGNGNSLGYGGITPSVDIEYDTYTNLDNRNDPPYNHIAIQKNGNASHFAGGGTLAGPVQASTTNTNIKDGRNHTTRVVWNASTKTFTIYFDGNLRLTYTSDIVTTIFGGNPNVYWGFTGATGGLSNLQTFCVTSLSFKEVLPLTLNVSSTNITCYGANNGNASATYSGGTLPYSFSWSNGATTSSIDNLLPGNYTATVTDATGVTLSKIVSISQPPAPAISCPADVVVNTASLLASYPLQNNLSDQSNQLGPITLLGNPPPFLGNGLCQNGKYIYSGLNNGQDAQTPNISSLDPNNFSLAIDFKITGLPLGQAPVILGGTLYRWLGIYLNAQGKVGIKYNNSNVIFSATTLTIDQWYSAQLIFENGIAKLFINGIIVHTQEIGTLITNNDYKFTTSDFSNGTALNGCIRNLKIYNGTAAECSSKVFYNSPVVTSTCNNISVTQKAGLPSGSLFPVGNTVNTFEIVNSFGYTSTCSFTVTVIDNIKPTITVQADKTVNNDPGKNNANVDLGLPAASDNCAVLSVVNDHPSSLYPIGITTVTWTVTDIHNNTNSAIQLITVKDIEPPTINCFAPITKANDIDVCQAIVYYTLPVAVDNGSTNSTSISAGCSDGVIEFSLPASNNVSSLNFISTGTYADIAHGHSINNTITIELYDATNNRWILVQTVQTGKGDYHFGGTSISFPVISKVTKIRFSSTETIHCSFHFYLLQINLNSSNIIQTAGLPSGSSFPVGITTNTFMATDAAGNTSTCSFTVNVTDKQNPLIIGKPSNITQNNDLNSCGAIVSWTPPTATDNCGGVTIVSDHQPGELFPIGITTVTYTAKDAYNNSSSSSFTVTVEDNQQPTITAPADIIVNTIAGQSTAIISIGTPITADNCKVDLLLSDHPSTTFTVGITKVTWTVKDIHGKSNIATQTITVRDVEKPVIAGLPISIIQTNDAGICGAIVKWILPVANDNASPVTLTSNHQPGEVFLTGVTTVIYTATDASGNISTASFTITVTDNEAPIVITKNFTTTLVNGIASITTFDINNGSKDNCGISSLTASKTTFDCTNIGTNTVTLTAADANGNISSNTALVTVTGNIPTSTIIAIPSSTTYTGGVATNIYLGFGAQSVTLQQTTTGTIYSWTGNGTLSCNTCLSPVFTPSSTGIYTFTCTITNEFGCKTTSSISICVRDIRVTGSNGTQVYICHNTTNKPPQTVAIAISSVDAYLIKNPDDKLGSCDLLPCAAFLTPAITTISTNLTQPEIQQKDMIPEEGLSVKVSPNPTNSTFTFIISSNRNSAVSIKILNNLGQEVDGNRNAPLNVPVHLGGKLLSGSYFAEILQYKERKLVKLVKVNQ